MNFRMTGLGMGKLLMERSKNERRADRELKQYRRQKPVRRS
ncbi:MAG: hypothetical protein OP8BY_0730 [Candidatus Saccharicenans subterraneus]|uniref:Uncharacterized protein n=1 Tax=Candidatus Saccharicenans subterraneus TaxID=2508984 RepID=A0A3E2BK21_9BACT|nr:MAG: hypothetical protein OP8BY_0730 [Candidatus Saccharicenans subterraneum]